MEKVELQRNENESLKDFYFRISKSYVMVDIPDIKVGCRIIYRENNRYIIGIIKQENYIESYYMIEIEEIEPKTDFIGPGNLIRRNAFLVSKSAYILSNES